MQVVVASLGALADRVDDVTRDGARRAAERELADPRYHHREPLVWRIARWALREIGELLDNAARHAPGGGWGLLGIAVLVVGVVLLARARLGSLAGSGSDRAVFAATSPHTAAAHRTRAVAAAAVGDWSVAVVERFRAVARELEEQGLVEPRLGRTALELGREITATDSTLGSAVRSAAEVFDEVQYGGRPGSAAGHDLVRAADELLTGSRAMT